MQDWNDYKYTMIVTYKFSGIEEEINSDNLLFLAGLGEDGLKQGMYTSATIKENK